MTAIGPQLRVAAINQDAPCVREVQPRSDEGCENRSE